MTEFALTLHEYGNPENTPLILLHGGTGLHHLWLPQLESLSESFYLIAPDLFYEDTSQLSVPKLATDVAKIIQRKFDFPVYVVGSSFGALVATQLSITQPEMVKGLVISGGRVFGDFVDKGNAFVMRFMQESVVLATMVDEISKLYPPIQEKLQDDLKRMGKEGFRAMVRAASEVNFRPQLDKITMPTLIMVGDKDKPVIKQECEMLYDGIDDAELHIIDGVGHSWHLVDQPLFDQMITDFVQRVDAGEF